ncbi:hypothetical protein [endosymbiont GvMRE of Glomus versiforme]|uniref:hypothetical protein n=1 Tax=endosymbiont GvMRE of Glomus versiforme TaxID=2039283 RepID=UPI000EDC5327|nr:hypothetical protein [endosymbiont GvMRE of Glomus versiforme]RHZ37433.1 hypothetical protein GvMRE_I1g556 [endosymbiont GvMRE of Glomus versiforme]
MYKEVKHGTDKYYRQFIEDWDKRHIRTVNFTSNYHSQLKEDYNWMLNENVDIFQHVETKKWMIYCQHCDIFLSEYPKRKGLSIVELSEIYYQNVHKPH